ncbi:protocatechuate 3,4-dioxygenase subunit alpha [Pelagibius litoralis]|uniref:Protocatechuate 3,4-dioxygenase subunit alpha n=1 Tax=Pelagibius litoralis TaxID=374515 RepID=A0A967EYZ4_9PROT|nr:protocatechuate 3,4-dioxygenase subunit alpha [Pelagibius litoralis]NIA69992.1 protocatechuate 3,4-dioxygenase subunit alpha [Pelagibius litoralis]
MSKGQTPSQTVGPFFAYGLTPEQYGYAFRSLAGADLRDPATAGREIVIKGQVFDGAGAVVTDAMIEIWQADPQGRYLQPGAQGNRGFTGFGRCGTGYDDENGFRFTTYKPGTVDERQAPHVTAIVFMRGLLSHLYTRIYFADEAEANGRDPILASVEPARRATLIAEPEEPGTYRFDIHMQGERETVFFDV